MTQERNSNISCSCCPIGIGTILAMLLSWTVNHSIVWAIIHAIFGWFYVIYYAFKYGVFS